ncbi:MAG: hypothetical protein QM539_04405 [Alphaproteobacteria bacterium]|nr:hypothetical protein [Alphaproteobacteria bacterium]
MDFTEKFKNLINKKLLFIDHNKSINDNRLLELFKLRFIDNSQENIVCSGFQTLDYLIKQDPAYLFLCASGNYYFQIPINFNELNNSINKFSKKKDLIYRYLLPSFDFGKLTHSLKNEIGLYYTGLAFFENCKLCFNSFFKDKAIENYEIKIKNNIENIVYDYLTKHDSKPEISNSGGLSCCKKDENKVNKTSTETNNENKKESKQFILYIDDKADTGWAALLAKIFEIGITKKIALNSVNKNESKDKCTCDEKSIFNYCPPNTCTDKKIFFEFGKDNLKTKCPSCISKDIKNIIEDHLSYDIVILLDLRLLDEDEKIINLYGISGYQLFKLLHSYNPLIPIIFVTATNDKNFIINLLEEGAFAVWSKEIDFFNLEKYSYTDNIKALNQYVIRAFASYDTLSKNSISI